MAEHKRDDMNVADKETTDLAIRRASRKELERRWSLVRARLAEEKLEALIVFASEDYLGANVRWLIDRPATFAYHCAIIFPANDLMTLVEHGNLGGQRHSNGEERDYPGVGEILTTAAFHSVSYTQRFEGQILADAIRARGYRRIGIAGRDAMPHGVVRSIESVPNLEVTDLTDFVERARSVKSAEEIEEIRATAAMQDAIFTKLLATVKPGMRDMDVTAMLVGEGRKRGSSQHVLLAGSAPNNEVPAPRGFYAQGRVMCRGDYLTVLIESNGAGGLYTELGRTVVLGKPCAERLDALAIACAAQEDSVKRYRPGASCAELAAAHDEFRAGSGLPHERRLFAHGQGYALVERPLLRADESMTLAADMNIVTHPMFVRGSAFGFVCDNHILHAGRPAERIHRTEQRIFAVDC
jgi:Xaa-Pro aminopeptidase